MTCNDTDQTDVINVYVGPSLLKLQGMFSNSYFFMHLIFYFNM